MQSPCLRSTQQHYTSGLGLTCHTLTACDTRETQTPSCAGSEECHRIQFSTLLLNVIKRSGYLTKRESERHREKKRERERERESDRCIYVFLEGKNTSFQPPENIKLLPLQLVHENQSLIVIFQVKREDWWESESVPCMVWGGVNY